MADIISADALIGAGLALAAAGALAGVKWLVAGKAKQFDGLPLEVQAIKMELVKIVSRLDRAEADIANDKAGRRAFAAVEVLVTKISSDIGHLSAEVQKLSAHREKDQDQVWSAINRIRENRDAA